MSKALPMHYVLIKLAHDALVNLKTELENNQVTQKFTPDQVDGAILGAENIIESMQLLIRNVEANEKRKQIRILKNDNGSK